MSRLSLKPGGEPGYWVVRSDIAGYSTGFTEVSDEDLQAILRELVEYFAAKEPVVEKPKLARGLRWWLVTACLALVPVCVIYLAYSYDEQHPPAPASTGGVIDELCMRPGVECSTNIHYVHPPEPR